MKKIIMVLVLILASSAYAADSNSDVANVNSNNTIVVKPQITIKGCCADKKCPPPQTIVKTVVVEKPIIVEKTVPVYVERTIVKEKIVVVKSERRKNRLSFLGGVGPTNLNTSVQNQVSLDRGVVGGLMYQRSLTELLNVGVQAQTNQTGLLSVGVDF